MVYELRTYRVILGRMPALHRRFAEITVRFFEKHGIEVVGFWTNEVPASGHELVYLLRYESLASRETRWAAFQNDPDWQKARAESERDGPIVARVRNAILRPTSYSPMQ